MRNCGGGSSKAPDWDQDIKKSALAGWGCSSNKLFMQEQLPIISILNILSKQIAFFAVLKCMQMIMKSCQAQPHLSKVFLQWNTNQLAHENLLSFSCNTPGYTRCTTYTKGELCAITPKNALHRMNLKAFGVTGPLVDANPTVVPLYV